MKLRFLAFSFMGLLLSACSNQRNAEKAVAQMASDPENVIFKDVTKSKTDDKTYCGEFRSKEGIANWGEFKQFVSDGSKVLIVDQLPTDFGGVLQELGPMHTQSDIDAMTERYNQTAEAMREYRLCKFGADAG